MYTIYRWSISSPSILARITGNPSEPVKIITSSNKIANLSTTAYIENHKLKFLPKQNPDSAEGPKSSPPETAESPRYSRLFSNNSLTLGLRSNGQVDLISPEENPRKISELDIVDLGLGPEHIIAVTCDGGVYTQGNGQYGRLGLGNNISSQKFSRVEFFDSRQALPYGKVAKVAAGGAFTAALTQRGALFVWGLNDAGQLALAEGSAGDMYSSKKYPTLVPFFAKDNTKLVDLACGDRHCLAVAENGVVFYWGNGDWLEPRPITLPSIYERGIKDIKKLVAGDKFSFLVTQSGELYYMGKVSSGPFQKSPEILKLPSDIFEGQSVLDVAVFGEVCVALTKDR